MIIYQYHVDILKQVRKKKAQLYYIDKGKNKNNHVPLHCTNKEIQMQEKLPHADHRKRWLVGWCAQNLGFQKRKGS